MKILKSIYYYIKYGSVKNYDVKHELDVLLIYLNEIGIKSISLSGIFDDEDYYYTIVFNDNTTIKFWNVNRWYAWMSICEINFSNGKKLKWDAMMPSYEVLYNFKKIIKAHEKVIKKENKGYDIFLPIKLIRKKKL